jgi:predicted aspartyl protease
MPALLLLLCLQTTPNVVVLRNGKTLNCEQVVRRADSVELHTGGQVFSLPATTIDWPATEKAQELRNRDLREAAERRQRELAARKEPQARQPIVLVQLEASEEQESAAIVLTRRGNSILVPVVLNGAGPFEIVLDTGAELTTISPEIAQKVGASRVEGSITVAGVGGTSQAELAQVQSIAVGSAQVNEFSFVTLDLSKNLGGSAIGLLGQDFLNHFVMELDVEQNRLLLTPRAYSGGNALDQRTDAEALASRWEELSPQWSSRLNQTADLYERYLGQSEQRSAVAAKASGEASQLIEYFQSFRSCLNQTISLGTGPMKAYLSEKQQADLSRFIYCHGDLDRLLLDLVRFSKNFTTMPGRSPAMDRDLSQQFQQLGSRMKETTSCLNPN